MFSNLHRILLENTPQNILDTLPINKSQNLLKLNFFITSYTKSSLFSVKTIVNSLNKHKLIN